MHRGPASHTSTAELTRQQTLAWKAQTQGRAGNDVSLATPSYITRPDALAWAHHSSGRDADPGVARRRREPWCSVPHPPCLCSLAAVSPAGTMNKPRSGSGQQGKRRGGGGGGLGGALRKQMARLCIIRECVIMLLFYHDWSNPIHSTDALCGSSWPLTIFSSSFLFSLIDPFMCLMYVHIGWLFLFTRMCASIPIIFNTSFVVFCCCYVVFFFFPKSDNGKDVPRNVDMYVSFLFICSAL